MNNILYLTVKRKWFDMISSGSKKEEYREIKPYWIRRFIKPKTDIIDIGVFYEMCQDLKNPTERHESLDELFKYFEIYFLKFDAVRFKNGYSKNCDQVTFICNGITIGKPNSRWTNDKELKECFIIKLGDEIPF